MLAHTCSVCSKPVVPAKAWSLNSKTFCSRKCFEPYRAEVRSARAKAEREEKEARRKNSRGTFVCGGGGAAF